MSPPAPFPATGADVPAPNVTTSTPATATTLAPNLSALLRVAQRTRPELRAASARVTGAALESGAIGASYKPQLNAFAMGDFGANGGNRNAGTTFGLVASIPVFTGGRRRASLQIADAQRRQLESEREQLALEIAQSVQVAYLNLNAAEQNVGTAQVALTSGARRLSRGTDSLSVGPQHNCRCFGRARVAHAGTEQRRSGAVRLQCRARYVAARSRRVGTYSQLNGVRPERLVSRNAQTFRATHHRLMPRKNGRHREIATASRPV